jgi:molybdopterin synthase catalytic subunit
MTSGAVVPGVVLAEIRDTPLSVDEVVEAVRHPSAGAVVTFIGYVRERDHGEPVEVLDYTSHPTADQVAHDLAARFAAEGRVVRLGVVHRTGHLTIGDIAVVAAVSAEHRREAFEVCHALIDEFKSTVPIWKHQTFTDGSDEWVGLP